MTIAALALFLVAGSTQGANTQAVELDADRKPTVQTNGNCLIKGGTVITVTGPVLQDADVLIQNGKIVAVGKGLSAPAGVTVIDARGKIVTPGIVDAHSHMGAYSNVNEGADSVVPEVRVGDIINPEDESFYIKLGSGFTTALVLHGSANPIGGESQIIKLKRNRPLEEVLFPGAPRVVKFALGENVKRSNGDGPQDRFPATRMGVEATFRRAFTEARAYMDTWAKYNANPVGQAPRRDIRLEALSNILTGKIIVHCHAYRADEMIMLSQLQKEFGFKLMAFTHGQEAYKLAPELAARGIGASVFADAWAYKVEVQDGIAYNPYLLWKAGVLTSVNTDTGGGLTPVNIDAAKSMRFGGVPPEEAIKFVTINPAKQLGLDSRIGSLEAGKDADIAIWEGHPLSAYSRCAMTLVDGEVYFQRRDAMKLGDSGKRVSQLQTPMNVDLEQLPYDSKLVALVNGTVHPMSGDTIEGGTVVIQDGKILAVGKNVTVPSGARVLDLKGLHVYPGLFDAGSQVGMSELGSVRATRDTTDIGDYQPDLVAGTVINPESDHIAVTRLGGITTTVLRPLGPRIPGQGSLVGLDGWTTEHFAMVPRATLFINFPAGVEGLPNFILNSLSPDQRREREDAAKEDQVKLREYLEMAKRYLSARKEDAAGTPVDLRLEALEPYLSGKRPVVINAGSPESIREAVKMAGDLGLRMILWGGKETWKVASFLAEKKVPVILQPAGVTSLTAAGSGPAQNYDPYDSYHTQPAVLHRAGVTFAFASGDSAMAYELPIRAAFACAYGLPYDAALKALTVNPAKMFGVDDMVGTLEPGKVANVIVVDGDPLEVSTRVRSLFIHGRPIPLESRWTRLFDKYRARLQE
jgi:imidazolonepropionase-like amidohydrolase